MANEKREPKCGNVHTKYDGSWWEHDARGIPLARVCHECIGVKLKKYRPEVLRNSGYWADEEVDP